MKVYLSIGSNKNDRLFHIQQALSNIEGDIGRILRKSEIFRTESWGYRDVEYLNMCVIVETALSPDTLMRRFDAIEKRLGRSFKTVPDGDKGLYQSREIDIDLLFYGEEQVNKPDCMVPHPKIQERLFVLKPLDQIASDFIHPVLRETIHTLLMKCTDLSYVIPYEDFIRS